MKTNRNLAVLFTLLLPLIVSCDAVYIVRGTISEVVPDQSPERLPTSYLDGVAVRLSYYVDEKGNIGPVVDHLFSTDNEGKYDIFFIWSPFGLGHDVFLDFKKPGYEQKKIIVSKDNKDPAATVKRCPEKTPYRGCWVVDVILTPESGQRSNPIDLTGPGKVTK